MDGAGISENVPSEVSKLAHLGESVIHIQYIERHGHNE